MNRITSAFSAAAALVTFLAGAAAARTGAPPDSGAVADTIIVRQAPPPKPPPPREQRVYYGGSVVASFGNPDHVGIFPSVGYKVTPKLSMGAKVGYEYLKYDGYKNGLNNYGGSLFTRYKVTPRMYGHAEFQGISTEIYDYNGPGNDGRAFVPYLLLGGGLTQPLGPTSSAYVEVLFDVLQDKNSPYDAGQPFISFGVAAGF